MKSYGFFANSGLTLSEYVKVFCTVRDNSRKEKNAGNNKRGNEEAADDLDSVSGLFNFWRVPIPEPNWREKLSIDLSKEEADYLKQKITTMPNTKDSLLALILRETRVDFCDYSSFDDLDTLLPVMPEAMKNDYIMARDFANFIFGAQIRYNIIFTKGQEEYVQEEWAAWKEDVPTIDLDKLFVRLNVRNLNLMHFLKAYQNTIGNEQELDKLIIAREKQLKGPSRSKLVNENLYQYSGKLINMDKLYYRFYNARRIVGDIFAGAGESHA